MIRSLSPFTADNHLQEGNGRLALNDYMGAAAAYQNALAIDPQSAEAHYYCGVAFHKLGELNQAAEHYHQAIRLLPELTEAHYNLAHAYAELNRFDESERAYLKVLQFQPRNAEAAYNLGLLYKSGGLFDSAVERFQQALRIRPDYAEALNNIGVIWRDQDKLEQALICFEQALAMKPALVEALYNIGVTLQKQGEFDQAIEMFRRALELNPHYAPARWLHLLALPMLYESEDTIESHRRRFTGNLARLIQSTPLESCQDRKRALEGVAASTNFYLQYQGRNDLDLQKQYGRFVVNVMRANFPQWSLPRPMPPHRSGEKIRIGYLSSCMYAHTIGIFLMGWLKDINRNDFEWFCYHVGDRTDALTTQFIETADHFYHYPGDVTGAAAQIAADNLHILVHTDIGMSPVTLQLAALRLAPVQCKGWGHPVTTGLPTIDFYLSSDLMESNQAEKHYTEKLIRLPNIALNYSPPTLPAAPKSRSRFGIPDGDIVYLTTQSLFKYLPQHDDIFVKIAQQVPNASFVFIAHNHAEVTDQFERRLSKIFEAHNTPFRCLFVPRMKHNDFLSLNMAADVLLDTLEWSGGKTSLEALACDLPVVTLPGAFMRGRHTYAFLTRMGLTDTIAADKADYIRKAVRLGLDRDFHAQLKNQIRIHKDRLLNDQSVTQALEHFYKQVLQAPPPGKKPGNGTDAPDSGPCLAGLITPTGDKARPQKSDIMYKINILANEGRQLLSQQDWQTAAVCFERALAHIPNFLSVNRWYQYYLLDDAPPPDCSPDFAADLYAMLSQCRAELGQFETSACLSDAALRLDPLCIEARRVKERLSISTRFHQVPISKPSKASIENSPFDATLADQLTILIISSFTNKVVRYKELAPPTTGLVRATYASALQNLGDWMINCKKHLCYDRPNQRSPIDQQYEQELSGFSETRGFHFNTFDYAGLQTVVHRMLEQIDTPYLLFLEHDWFFQAPPIDLTAIITLFDQHPEINYVRFNKRANIISNLDFLLSMECRWGAVPLLRTAGHSNNPHIVRVSTLKNKWLPICLSDPIGEKRELRGTVFGTEDSLFKRHMIDVRRWGFDQAHTHWGTYIYGAFEAPATIIHLGE